MKNFSHKEHNKSGIYQIQNIKNGKSYIGSSISIYYRTRGHLSDLRKNKHHSTYMQRSFNKYGEDQFSSTILEYCDKSKLLEREQYWIKLLKPEYNTVQTPERIEIAPETRVKISISLKKRYKEGLKSYDQEHNKKWIEVYDLEGKFLKRYDSLAEAERELVLHRGRLSYYIGSKVKIIGREYQYTCERYPHNIEDLSNYKQKTNNKKIIAEHVDNKERLFFNSIVECSNYFNVHPAYIQGVLKRYKKPIFRKTYYLLYE